MIPLYSTGEDRVAVVVPAAERAVRLLFCPTFRLPSSCRRLLARLQVPG